MVREMTDKHLRAINAGRKRAGLKPIRRKKTESKKKTTKKINSQEWINNNFHARFNDRDVNTVLKSVLKEGKKQGVKISRNDFIKWWKKGKDGIPRSTKYLIPKSRLRKEVLHQYGF